MRYKGGLPPLMIYAALRASMICQACGLDKKIREQGSRIFWLGWLDSEPLFRHWRNGKPFIMPAKSQLAFGFHAGSHPNHPKQKPPTAKTVRGFCWLGWLDSNQRKCQSQSLVPYRLATAQCYVRGREFLPPIYYSIAGHRCQERILRFWKNQRTNRVQIQ